MIKLLIKNKLIILYGVSLALLIFLLKWLEWRFLIMDHAVEIYIGFIAIIFTSLGVWLALKLTTPKVETIIVEKKIFINQEPDFTINQSESDKLGLSKRELEVLQLMAQGLSNQEIASRLYVSLNTIKTHSSRIFEKMSVKRRTQAVELAKRLQIIP
ncbi:MAG: LuxR C-terminal-related transcriptional regulator [Chitinophagaceae bacterium]